MPFISARRKGEGGRQGKGMMSREREGVENGWGWKRRNRRRRREKKGGGEIDGLEKGKAKN